MRQNLHYDVDRLAALTDITPTLYYLLGHRPIKSGPIYGQPLVADSRSELDQYQRHRLFLASDVRAAFGELDSDGGSMYVTYDSPPASYYFDLRNDPAGLHNAVTDQIKRGYDAQIVSDLRSIADFYGYKPSGGSSGVFRWDRIQSQPGHFATDVRK
jgi:arylsulfatase A-like enzyme